MADDNPVTDQPNPQANWTPEEIQTIQRWQHEKTATGRPRRAWADGSNAQISQHLAAAHEHYGSLPAALQSADDRFGAQPVLSSTETKVADSMYHRMARDTLIRQRRERQPDTPPGWNPPKAQIQAVGRQMYAKSAARERAGR